jgi:lipoyl(octanoyl) transferase
MIKHTRLGLIDYERALRHQQEAHQKCIEEDSEGVIFSLEHKPVLTIGKNGSLDHLQCDEISLEKNGIKLIRTDRGGEVTAHMPGQLVIYPILPLKKFALTVRSYVCLLEGAVIETLLKHGIMADRDPINPGVWVGENKISALGVRIKDKVSMHGLSLNICNDLVLYDSIVPCGIKGRGVTSMQRVLERGVDFSEVETDLVECITSELSSRLKV